MLANSMCPCLINGCFYYSCYKAETSLTFSLYYLPITIKTEGSINVIVKKISDDNTFTWLDYEK